VSPRGGGGDHWPENARRRRELGLGGGGGDSGGCREGAAAHSPRGGGGGLLRVEEGEPQRSRSSAPLTTIFALAPFVATRTDDVWIGATYGDGGSAIESELRFVAIIIIY